MKIIKEFLKPGLKKLIIFFLLVFLISIVSAGSVLGGCCTKETYYFTIPTQSIIHREIDCDSPLAGPECKPESSFRIIYQSLALNLVFWYLISCLIVWIYDKVKKK
jgi:hypothetical protein